MVALSDDLRLDRQMRHNIEVVIDRLVASPDGRARLAEAVELALRMGQGNLIVSVESRDAAAPVRRADEVDAAPARRAGRKSARAKPAPPPILPPPSTAPTSTSRRITRVRIAG